MDRGANSDLFFLPDEKFDFDVSLSPASSTGEDFEDEVFVGPVGHRERCISVNVVSRLENRCVKSSWSPLSGDQLEAICEEAHKVAEQLQGSEPENIDPNTVALQNNEFVQDSDAKLRLLCDPVSTVLSPIKRETFCVQDSPLKQLPPAIQSRILKARCPKTSIENSKQSIKPVGKAQPTQHAPTRATRSVASPHTGVRTQTKASLRGRTGIEVTVVLPSRPAAPTASRSTAKNQVEKGRLQPPSKLSTSWRRSPNSSRNGSCEDLLSDSASVASDVSDSSLNSSCLSKRTLAPPTKALRTRSGVKPPSDSSRLRNTSSSSSSVSSFNSSISLSPANKGKLNSSLNSQCSVSKPSHNPRRSVVVQPPDRAVSAAGRRSLSVQTRKPSNPTPLRKPQPAPVQTPVRRGLGRTCSVPSVTTKPKPQALVPPAPNATLPGSSSPDTSKILKPKRLISMNSADGLHPKPVRAPLTPSGGSSSSLQFKGRRPSALPTPVRSRLSGLPQATPKSQVRPIKALPADNCAPSSVTPPEDPESVDAPAIQPFNLEEEEPVQSPPTIAISHQSQSSTTPDALCPSQSQTGKEPAQELKAEPKAEPVSKTQEVLLLDLPAPALHPQEKLLIDLRNTPDLSRTKSGPSASELIDLSSPLIKWSPVNKKKDAPLINLSF